MSLRTLCGNYCFGIRSVGVSNRLSNNLSSISLCPPACFSWSSSTPMAKLQMASTSFSLPLALIFGSAKSDSASSLTCWVTRVFSIIGVLLLSVGEKVQLQLPVNSSRRIPLFRQPCRSPAWPSSIVNTQTYPLRPDHSAARSGSRFFLAVSGLRWLGHLCSTYTSISASVLHTSCRWPSRRQLWHRPSTCSASASVFSGVFSLPVS